MRLQHERKQKRGDNRNVDPSPLFSGCRKLLRLIATVPFDGIMTVLAQYSVVVGPVAAFATGDRGRTNDFQRLAGAGW
jgi:hypothetical protein